MNLTSRLQLSYYEEIASLSKEHHIHIVQHRQTKQIFVKKQVQIYDLAVYEYLKASPIAYIPRIYELIPTEDSMILIEEYISGNTLEQTIETFGPMDEASVLRYGIQLCQILQKLHSHTPPVIHRDLKPSNLILSPEGNLFLLDFNAAKFENPSADRDTMLLGTHGFAAPEQYGFGPSDVQTDIYSIGVLFQYLLTGTVSRQCIVQGCLKPVITKCMQMDSAKRYPSISALLRALAKLTGQPASDSRHPYALPGFRNGNIVHMLMASLGYAWILYLSCTLTIENIHGTGLILDRIFFFITCILMVFCHCNYRGITRHFYSTKKWAGSRRFACILALDLGLLFLFIIISCILELFL